MNVLQLLLEKRGVEDEASTLTASLWTQALELNIGELGSKLEGLLL